MSASAIEITREQGGLVVEWRRNPAARRRPSLSRCVVHAQ